MQIIRTILWIALTALLVAFIAMNWEFAEVNVWPLANGYLHFNWPVGVIALVFFLLGLLPMYLVSRAGRWRLHRRIASLENTLAATAPPAPVAVTPAVATPIPVTPASEADLAAVRATTPTRLP